MRTQDQHVHAFFVGSDQAAFEELQKIASSAEWTLERYPSHTGLRVTAETWEVSVVFCSDNVPGGTWRDVLAELSRCQMPPRLFIVQEPGKSCLWADVMHAGGWEVLTRPLRGAEVNWLVAEAHRTWCHPRPIDPTQGVAVREGTQMEMIHGA